MNSSNINKQLEALKDKVIKVDRGGPNSRVGKLVAVHDDYITLLTNNDGVLYYNMDHIKSVTENVKDGLDGDDVDEIEEESRNVDCNTPHDFRSFLSTLKYKWVQINRGGPAKVDGVVNDITDEVITLVHDQEVIRVVVFHINNVSVGNKPKKDKDDGKKDDKKDDNKKDDHDKKEKQDD
ncbi:hypothetical protein LG329_12350 [Virgibacillus necropolis]|uniref:hypothetical protein n=1 Tax=Virgibacillus necropolis TaxID=163877 RepID=UPI003850CE73